MIASVVTKFLLLVLIIRSISGSYEDSVPDIINKCKDEVLKFAKTEDKFAAKDFKTFFEVSHKGHDGETVYVPSIARNPLRTTLREKYEKESKQKLYECLTSKVPKSEQKKLEENDDYNELVEACREQDKNTPCNATYPYRSYDGTCNNLKHKVWGSTFHCLRRLLPPSYEGVSDFRKSRCGGKLPPARSISLKIHTAKNRPSDTFTNMFPFFGQLIAHDMTDLALTTVKNQTINCCSKKDEHHPQCAPILISKDDPFYKQFKVTCINFIRASPCKSCKIGKRNQMIDVTSYIDASFVYGSDDATAKQLRDKGGKLRVQYRQEEELLPADLLEALKSVCGDPAKEQYCFKAGDRRVNQHSALSSLQTVCLREHNRIAEVLSEYNSHWSDEKLYQEARKINIAQFQVIIYSEFLPMLIGPDLMTKYDMWVLKEGRSTYDDSLDATMISEFNGAAYRLHSTVNGRVVKKPIDGNRTLLRDMFTRAAPIYNHQIDPLMKRMCIQRAQNYDRYVSQDLTNFMYRVSPNPGADIASANIQRGLDIGLPPYVDVVNYLLKHYEYRDIEKIESFDDFYQLMDDENVELLKDVYCDYRDVDLWVGMNLESVDDDMFVGPTAAEIIALQFWYLKDGDRFYFQHDGQFTDKQLKTLKKTTLTKILCLNTNIESLQKYAMAVKANSRNRMIDCSKVRGLDLSCWKEKNKHKKEEDEEDEDDEDDEEDEKYRR